MRRLPLASHGCEGRQSCVAPAMNCTPHGGSWCFQLSAGDSNRVHPFTCKARVVYLDYHKYGVDPVKVFTQVDDTR